MPNCAVPSCYNRSSVKSNRQKEIEEHTNITFHRFPKAEDRRLRWANALGLEVTTLKNACICSLHFPEDSFDRTSLVCVRLRNHAIPCINKADVSKLRENDYLSHIQQASSTNEAVQSSATEKGIFAEKIVSSSDEALLSYHGTPKKYLREGEDCENSKLERKFITSIVHESTTQPIPLTSDASTQTSTYPNEAMTLEPTDSQETAIHSNCMWQSKLLREAMKNEKEKSRKLIQLLKKQNWRQRKKIAELKSILSDLKAENVIADERCDMLKTIGMSNTHFSKRIVAKTASKLVKGEKKNMWNS